MQKYPLLHGDPFFTERNGRRVMRNPHITNPTLRPALVFVGRNGAVVMWEHVWKRINLFYYQEFPHITQGGFWMVKHTTGREVGFVMWDARITRRPFRSVKTISPIGGGEFCIAGKCMLTCKNPHG